MTCEEAKLAKLIVDHKEKVAVWLAKFSAELAYRAAVHDNSKFSPEEFTPYSKVVEEFGKYEFGSEEDEELKRKLGEGAILHRKRNRHHPEHFENGIDGMNLVDLLEILSDWRAATERSPGNSLRKSLKILKDQYKISPQLIKILENTANDFRMF